MRRHRQQRPVGDFIDLAHPFLNCFGLRLDADETGYFDDSPRFSRETVWGFYSTLPLTTKSTAATLNNIH